MSEADDKPVRPGDDTDPAEVEKFIGRWQKSGGSELANFQTFAGELCDLLGLPRPDPSQEINQYNEYVFERRVDFKFDDGATARRRIDLYKRDCFVMEGKQSAKRIKAKAADPDQPTLIPEDATQVKAGTATRGTGGWDKAMRAAKQQAEDYARALHEIADGLTARRLIRDWVRFYNLERPHAALDGRTPAEAYRGETPVDMMDKPLRALPTSPQAQQQQQEDRSKGILAA